MPRIDIETRRRRVADARVGRLATVTPTGDPHVVPCCFVLAEDDEGSAGPGAEPGGIIYWVVDAKPKSTLNLKRLDNVRATPAASLVVDHYDDDWTRLWWVRVDGSATVLDPGPESERALELLTAKYAQYRTDRPPGAIMRIDITRWTGWAASL